MKLLIPTGWQAECMHTNHTVAAHDIVAKLEITRDRFNTLTDVFFAERPPKGGVTITFVKKLGNVEQRVYYSHYPTGVLHIGNTCRLVMSEAEADRNKVWPKELVQPATKEPVDSRDTTYKPYKIYHMTEPDWQLPVKEQQPREYAGIIFTTSLELAYQASQGEMSTWRYTGRRSTSVGDVIEENDVCYLVAGVGFKMLPDVKFTKTENEVAEWAYEQYQQSILEDLSKPRIPEDGISMETIRDAGAPGEGRSLLSE